MSKTLTESEKRAVASLLWIVGADEEINSRVMSLFRETRDDRMTTNEFSSDLHSALLKLGK